MDFKACCALPPQFTQRTRSERHAGFHSRCRIERALRIDPRAAFPALASLARAAQKPMPCGRSIPCRRFPSECRGECLPPSVCRWPGYRSQADPCQACFGLETGRRTGPANQIEEVERPRPYSPFVRQNSTFADFGAIRKFTGTLGSFNPFVWQTAAGNTLISK